MNYIDDKKLELIKSYPLKILKTLFRSDTMSDVMFFKLSEYSIKLIAYSGKARLLH